MENNLNDNLVKELKINENSDQQNLERDSSNVVEEQSMKPQETLKSEENAFKNFEDKIQRVEKKTKDNISKVEMLLKAGLLNQVQGENLIQQIIKKGYAELEQCDLDSSEKLSTTQKQEKSFDKVQAITEFEKENPEFFNEKGRLEVLNYIKSGSLEFDKEELGRISELIKTVEQRLIDI